jgi:hypothetical protein
MACKRKFIGVNIRVTMFFERARITRADKQFYLVLSLAIEHKRYHIAKVCDSIARYVIPVHP